MKTAIRLWNAGADASAFVGSNVLAFFRMLRGTAQFRWSDVMMVMGQCGPQALAVVALINFLVGVILAFVGAVQLRQFGASIYVADLVAIGTVREMGCIMTGVILCGRTGAAFAAELGAMKVNEEIAAFKTFVVVVTHELPSIFAIGDHAIFVDSNTRSVRAEGNPRELLKHSDEPNLHEFLTRGGGPK